MATQRRSLSRGLISVRKKPQRELSLNRCDLPGARSPAPAPTPTLTPEAGFSGGPKASPPQKRRRDVAFEGLVVTPCPRSNVFVGLWGRCDMGISLMEARDVRGHFNHPSIARQEHLRMANRTSIARRSHVKNSSVWECLVCDIDCVVLHDRIAAGV